MYKCTGCGGALKFDIPSQKLKCDYCSTLYDPESVDDVSEAADKGKDVTDKMSVNMFSCPSCGGKMYSSDNRPDNERLNTLKKNLAEELDKLLRC